MDSSESLENTVKQLPQWNCELDKNGIKKVTVGDVLYLKCSGLEAVEVLNPNSESSYEFAFPKENMEFILFILSNTKDEPNEKIFRVTSYYANKSDFAFKLKIGETGLFQSSPVKLEVATVIESKQQQPYLPPTPGFILPGTTQLIALAILLLSVLGYLIFRLIEKSKKSAEYKRILLMADYPDPYVDFNIDIRNLNKKLKKKSDYFSKECEQVFKKLFFRIFQKPVSLESGRSLTLELRRRGVPQHKIRSLYVLRKDYYLILDKKLESDQVEEFLLQSKRIIADIKNYLKVDGGGSHI